MPRNLETEWPSYVNSSGNPDNGTEVNKAMLDAMRDAIDSSIYHPDHEEGPPEIIDEVTGARDIYASLDARLDAIAALAAGSEEAAVGSDVAVNLIPNGDFLIFSAGDAALPDGWQVSYAGAGPATFARIAHDTYASVGGKNAFRVATAAGGTTDIYFDVVPGALQGVSGRAPLKNAKVAAAIWINAMAGYASKVETFIQDSNASTQQCGKQGATTSAGATPDAAGWVLSSAVDVAYNGGVTLSATPDRLRFIVRITGAAVVYLQLGTLGWGDKCPRALESDYEVTQFGASIGADTPLITGVKAKWLMDTAAFIESAYGLATVAGTAVVTMGGATFTFTASASAVVTFPANLSIAKDAAINYEVVSTDTTIRSPLCAIRVLKPVQHLRGLFGEF